jgi:hypothetical protein
MAILVDAGGFVPNELALAVGTTAKNNGSQLMVDAH